MKTIKFLFVTTVIALISTFSFAKSQLKSLIEVEHLKAVLGSSSSQTLPLDIRSPEEYAAGHIPQAINSFYGKNWRELREGIPGLLPEKKVLESLLSTIGLEKDSQVVVIYGGDESSDFGSAARVYWTLKVAGISDVSILNGGHKAWVTSGQQVSKENRVLPSSLFDLTEYDTRYYADKDYTKQSIGNKNRQLLDARPENQFNGYEKHNASRVGGTIPSAKNLSQFDFLDNKSGRLRPVSELNQIIAEKELSKETEIVSFCNTGHWAATNWFVLSEVAGYPTKLYDGSMVEWTADKSSPIENIKNRVQLWWHGIAN